MGLNVSFKHFKDICKPVSTLVIRNKYTIRFPHTYTHIRTHAHTRTQAHTHTRTHAHTHTHTLFTIRANNWRHVFG